jgi:hypothetical protein
MSYLDSKNRWMAGGVKFQFEKGGGIYGVQTTLTIMLGR